VTCRRRRWLWRTGVVVAVSTFGLAVVGWMWSRAPVSTVGDLDFAIA